MISPRNSLILLRLVIKETEKIGKILVSGSLEKSYSEAEIVEVGPGNISAEGGRSETFDLKPGQRVLVKSHMPDRFGNHQLAGVKYVQGDEVLYLYDQMSIVGIVAQPGGFEPASAERSTAGPKLVGLN